MVIDRIMDESILNFIPKPKAKRLTVMEMSLRIAVANTYPLISTALSSTYTAEASTIRNRVATMLAANESRRLFRVLLLSLRIQCQVIKE